MADTISVARRSWNMSRIRSRYTSPEIAARHYLRQMGIRYRSHPKNIPGKPDFILLTAKQLVYIDGCFWHGHTCRDGQLPKTNSIYWTEKIRRNKRRDRKVTRELRNSGWKVYRFWACKLEQEFSKLKGSN